MKLIRYYDDNSVELYDLANDLGETTNLAQTSVEVRARLAQKLDDWLKASGASLPTRVVETTEEESGSR